MMPDRYHVIAFGISVAGFLALVWMLLHFKLDLATAAPGIAMLVGVFAMAFTKQLGKKDTDVRKTPDADPK